MMLPRLHYDVTVPARIQSLLSAVCEHTLAEKQMSSARHILLCMGNKFYQNLSNCHKISDRKTLKHIYWNLRKRQTLVFAAVEWRKQNIYPDTRSGKRVPHWCGQHAQDSNCKSRRPKINTGFYLQKVTKLMFKKRLYVTISVSNRCNLFYIFISYIFSHPTCFGPS
jgi:hypothetical protein